MGFAREMKGSAGVEQLEGELLGLALECRRHCEAGQMDEALGLGLRLVLVAVEVIGFENDPAFGPPRGVAEEAVLFLAMVEPSLAVAFAQLLA